MQPLPAFRDSDSGQKGGDHALMRTRSEQALSRMRSIAIETRSVPVPGSQEEEFGRLHGSKKLHPGVYVRTFHPDRIDSYVRKALSWRNVLVRLRRIGQSLKRKQPESGFPAAFYYLPIAS